MSTQEKPTIQEQAEQIKMDMDKLRRQWDRLDEERQLDISRRIGKAQEKLKKLTGEVYRFHICPRPAASKEK